MEHNDLRSFASMRRERERGRESGQSNKISFSAAFFCRKIHKNKLNLILSGFMISISGES